MAIYQGNKLMSGFTVNPDKKSAYEAALLGGYKGTEEEFNKFLAAAETEINNKSSIAFDAILFADSWQGGKQTIQIDGLTADRNGIAALPQNCSAAEYEAAAAALIFASEQTNGALTFLCNGDVPNIDIPVMVILLG